MLWIERENYPSEGMWSDVQKVRPTLKKTKVPPKLGKDH